MPSIKELEEFKQTFRTIGNEAGASAERGMVYNDLPLPDTEPVGNPFAGSTAPPGPGGGFPPDLFSGTPAEENTGSGEDLQGDGDFDFGAFLDTIPDDLTEASSQPGSPNMGSADDDMDFNDGLGDLLSGFADDIEAERAKPDDDTGFENIETAGEPDFEDFGDFSIPDEPEGTDNLDLGNLDELGSSGENPDSGDFSIPDDSMDMGIMDFGDLDSPGTAEDSAGAGAGEPDFEDFGDFSVPEDSADPGNMDLGNLDDLDSLGDPADAVDADFEVLDSSNPDENIDTESTEFGDFGDFSIPGDTEDIPVQTADNPGLSDEEMFSLFSEDPSHVPSQEPQDDVSIPEDNFPEMDDLPDVEDLPSFEDAPEDEGFSMDIDSPPEDLPDPGDDFSGDGFDFSIPEGDDTFGEIQDDTPAADGEFSVPDMDDTSGDAMDLGGEFFEPAESGSDDGLSPDSFDKFSLDGENDLSSSFNLPESDFNIDDVAFEGTSNLDDSGFSLAGIDNDFKKSSGPAKPRIQPGSFKAEASPDVEEIQLSQEDLAKLEKTLNSYPLNLRIACEELIAEQAVAPELMSELIKKLINGASPKETANLAGKILGRTIPIPRGFEKKTGEELEAEQASFGYVFVHSFLPVFRTFLIIALVLLSLGFLIHQFVYIPVKADGIYKRGYERIGKGEYARANENFSEGLRVKKVKKWFFRYAEAFRDARQYAFAEQKYDELLRHYPRDKQGALDYAHLETFYLYNYQKADRILRNNILDYSVDDREGLFAQGENFLAWGEIDPSQLENARAAFARLMEKYGEKDIYLEQMLKYFIRTDNLAQVLPLKTYFMESPKKKIAAPTLAELGGYLLDKKFEQVRGVPDENVENIEGIRDLLLRAVYADPALPESHYHLARYYSRFGSIQEERVVLETAIKAFDAAPELSAKRLGYRIDAQRRYAWILTTTGTGSITDETAVNAQAALIKGINLYEDALKRRVLSRSPAFGRLYADLGDIEYFKGNDLDAALQNYLNAERNGWHPPEVIYRMGYIYYHTNKMADAMDRFFEVSTAMPLNRRLLYTLGNTSYLRGNYFVAQGYYSRLLDLLENERNRFPTLLPHDRPEHYELAERIMRAQNNLGVTLSALAERTGNVGYRTRALALYSESGRAWDFLTRNPTTVVRLFIPGTNIPARNQALDNTKYTLYPEPGTEPLIYTLIDKDVLEPSIWEDLTRSPAESAKDIPYRIRNKE